MKRSVIALALASLLIGFAGGVVAVLLLAARALNRWRTA